jgi:hypothetical protein
MAGRPALSYVQVVQERNCAAKYSRTFNVVLTWCSVIYQFYKSHVIPYSYFQTPFSVSRRMSRQAKSRMLLMIFFTNVIALERHWSQRTSFSTDVAAYGK